jgi:hypothetical protein
MFKIVDDVDVPCLLTLGFRRTLGNLRRFKALAGKPTEFLLFDFDKLVNTLFFIVLVTLFRRSQSFVLGEKLSGVPLVLAYDAPLTWRSREFCVTRFCSLYLA